MGYAESYILVFCKYNCGEFIRIVMNSCMDKGMSVYLNGGWIKFLD